MISEAEAERRRKAYLQQVVEIIGEHGWMIQGVFPTEADPCVPFAYTVGLTLLTPAAPELAVAGLGANMSAAILNGLAGQVLAGRRYTHGEVLADVLADGRVTIVDGGPGDRDVIWPGTARAIYGPFVRLQQVVWPDKHGRFPWDPGYAIDPAAQPLIGRPS